jgi:hypothetical protein
MTLPVVPSWRLQWRRDRKTCEVSVMVIIGRCAQNNDVEWALVALRKHRTRG